MLSPFHSWLTRNHLFCFSYEPLRGWSSSPLKLLLRYQHLELFYSWIPILFLPSRSCDDTQEMNLFQNFISCSCAYEHESVEFIWVFSCHLKLNEKIACKMAVILYAHHTMLINCAFFFYLVVEFNFRGLETIDGDWHYYSKLPYHTI